MRIKTAIASALVAAACLASAPAFAKVYNFSFTDTNNDLSVGQLTAVGAGPDLSVTGITGIFDTPIANSVITGLSPYAGADNTLYTGAHPPFSFAGISFNVATGIAYNLFADGSQLGQVLESQYNPVGYPNAGHYAEITQLSITAVPEPAAWGLMIVGLGLVGTAMRSARRTETAAA